MKELIKETKILPQDFIETMQKDFDNEFINQIVEGFKKEEKKVAFRVNLNKTTTEKLEETMTQEWVKFEKNPSIEWAYYLTEWREKELWSKDFYKNGEIYVQSPSSQIPVLALNPQKGEKVLDMTAAPGGKTTQISSLMKNTGEVVAVELNKIRYEKMLHNLKVQWANNVKALKMDGTELSKIYEEGYFDKILIDAPCSGEGRFDLNKEKSFAHYNKWFQKKIYKVQMSLVKSAVDLLKSGWELVYSTCTINTKENEWIAHMLLCVFKDLEIVDIELKMEDVIPAFEKTNSQVFKKGLSKAKRVVPTANHEWFFVVKFKKK